MKTTPRWFYYVFKNQNFMSLWLFRLKRAIRCQYWWTENQNLSGRMRHLLVFENFCVQWTITFRQRLKFTAILQQLCLVHLLSYTQWANHVEATPCIRAQVKATCLKFTASVRLEKIEVTLNVTWSSLLDRRLWLRNCWSNAIFSHGRLQGLQNSSKERRYTLVGGFSGWKK